MWITKEDLERFALRAAFLTIIHFLLALGAGAGLGYLITDSASNWPAHFLGAILWSSFVGFLATAVIRDLVFRGRTTYAIFCVSGINILIILLTFS